MSVDNHEILPVAIDWVQWEKDPETYLQQKAAACQALLWAVDSTDINAVNQMQDALFDIGLAAQKNYWHCNESMTYPLQRMSEDSQADREVSDLLNKLHRYIADIRPPRKSRPSLKERFLLLFSFRETAWQMWLDNYQAAKEKIGLMLKQLEVTQQQLKRDNQIAILDQQKLLHAEQLLRHDYDLVQKITAAIKLKLTDDKIPSQAHHKMVDQSFLDPLLKREIELQQQLLIARQAVMTLDLIVKHNESMVRHIEQAIMTSTVVLDVTAGLLLVTNKQQNLNHQLATGQSVTSVNTNELNRARNLINNALQEIEGVSQLNSEVENAIEKD